MTKPLTQQDLLLLANALNQFHQEIVEEIESDGDGAGTLLFFKVEKDGLAIKIAAKTDLDNEELKQYIEEVVEIFFQTYLDIANVKDLYQIDINENTNPPSFNFTNIQAPDELHDAFVTRLKYKSKPAPDKLTLKKTFKQLIEQKDTENLIKLFLSSQYTDPKSHERIIRAFKEVIQGLDPTEAKDSAQLLFLFETIHTWRNDIAHDNKLTQQMRPFLKRIHSIFETLVCEISNPLFIANINRLTELVGLEKICDLWVTHDLQRLEYTTSFIEMPKLLEIIKALDKHTQEKIVTQLLMSAVKNGNMKLISNLHKQFPDIYQTTKSNTSISQQTAFQAFEFLLTIKDTGYKKFATKQLHQIMAGFGYIEHDAGLLALASRNIFTPGKRDRDTLIINNTSAEIDALIELLSNSPRPFRQRFIVSGGHWTTYDFLIDRNGKAYILMLDSVGGKTTAELQQLNDTKKKLLNSIRKKNRFTDCKVYIGMEERQFDYVSCQVFSLDDIFHLYSVEDYLDPTMYPGGLFDYLEKNIIKSLQCDGHDIHFSRLPLHLIRNMHSTSLLEIMKTERIGESVLSHRQGDTPAKFHEDKQGFFSRQTKSGKEKKLNLRLESKLKKIQERCLAFLKANDLESARQKLYDHTLDGLREKLERPSLKLK